MCSFYFLICNKKQTNKTRIILKQAYSSMAILVYTRNIHMILQIAFEVYKWKVCYTIITIKVKLNTCVHLVVIIMFYYYKTNMHQNTYYNCLHTIWFFRTQGGVCPPFPLSKWAPLYLMYFAYIYGIFTRTNISGER